MSGFVYRVQDRDGRGPFKPGHTCDWADREFAPGQENLRPIFEEFGFGIVNDIRAKNRNGHIGCAVRTLVDICRWFSATERERLRKLGYFVVAIAPDQIIAEGKNQLVFTSQTPLNVAGIVVAWPEEAVTA